MTIIYQDVLEDKLSLFLQFLGEESQDEAKRKVSGLCNGFSFMSFRAEIFGYEDQNMRRMQSLVNKSEDDLSEMADLYKNYKEKRSSLLGMTNKNGVLSSLNRKIKEQYDLLPTLKNEESRALLQEKLVRLRNQREHILKRYLKSSFTDYELETIAEAEGLYVYVHTLLAAEDPLELDYQIQGKSLQQRSYVGLLELFSPIQKNKKEIHIETAFELAFNVTEEELIRLFSDERIICEGDYIALSSSDHAIYLSYQEGRFQLFDPGPIELEENTPEALVALIKDRFFTEYGVDDTEYMPIGMTVFEKIPYGKEKIARPESLSYLKDVLTSRGSNQDINQTKAWDQTTSLHMAVYHGNIEEVALLITAKSDVNAQDKEGYRPLFLAAQNNLPSIIDLLAGADADLNKPNHAGLAAIHTAAQNGQVEAIKALAHAKADINQKVPGDGATPVMVAVLFDKPLVIKALFDAGADLDKVNRKGSTPLHEAIKKSQVDLIRVFINCQASLDLKDANGHTPLFYASDKIKLLIQEQLELRQSFEKLKDIIGANLGDRIEIQVDHSTRNIPGLHLRLSGCSSEELTALNEALKSFGLETKLLKEGQEDRLVIPNLDLALIEQDQFVPNIKEAYEQLLPKKQSAARDNQNVSEVAQEIDKVSLSAEQALLFSILEKLKAHSYEVQGKGLEIKGKTYDKSAARIVQKIESLLNKKIDFENEDQSPSAQKECQELISSIQKELAMKPNRTKGLQFFEQAGRAKTTEILYSEILDLIDKELQVRQESAPPPSPAG